MEKFDLEKALAGHPVKLRCGSKAIIVFNANTLPYKNDFSFPLSGYVIEEDGLEGREDWTLEGNYSNHGNNEYDIIGMWEYGADRVSIELPRPLHRPELNSMIYIITKNFSVFGQVYKDLDHQENAIKRGRAFKTEEDAQMWLDALVNLRG